MVPMTDEGDLNQDSNSGDNSYSHHHKILTRTIMCPSNSGEGASGHLIVLRAGPALIQSVVVQGMLVSQSLEFSWSKREPVM